MMKVLKRAEIIGDLTNILSQDRDILLAYLFGSLASKGKSAHDIDIAILFDLKDSWARAVKTAELTVELAKMFNINEERINIVDLSEASLALKYAALSRGICLKSSPIEEELRKELLRDYPDFLFKVRREAILNSNPKPDIVLIETRVEELGRNITYLKKEVLSQPLNAVISDYKSLLAMERAIHRAIEAMLDICRHLVSVHDLGLVESYGDYPERLREARLMPEELSEGMRRLAGLRNILVHRYLAVKYELLYPTINELINKVYPGFMGWVETLIRDDRHRTSNIEHST